MKLIAYKVCEHEMPIQPAPHTRAWMDLSPEGYAYRCLPLVMANQFGWELLCPEDFGVIYDGGPSAQDIFIPDPAPYWVHSHFGMGVLTFSTPYLFRTPPGVELLVTGPANQHKHRIAALEGIVETSWSPYSFTVNWQFTAPGPVRFVRGEPLCRIVPIPSPEYIEGFEPEMIAFEDMPPKEKDPHVEWAKSRGEFIAKLRANDPDTEKQGWQKTYMKEACLHKLKLKEWE